MTVLLVVRSLPQPATHYSDYKEPLRVDFWFSCAYCSVTEIEAGGLRMTIDHYEPTSARADLKHAYTNLMWCCSHCNELKNNTDPPHNARRDGLRFLRPDEDIESEHLTLVGCRVDGITTPGAFTASILDLNRKSLRDLRDVRRRLDDSEDHIRRGLTALRGLSPERLPLRLRAEYQRIATSLVRSDARLSAQVDDEIDDRVLREMNRSAFLDTDPDAKTRTKARRNYLKKQKAVYSDPFRPPRNSKK